MGGWTVRLMWSLHFGFGCSLLKILTCCQHMLRYSVWILTKLPLWRPSLNRSQQRIIETSNEVGGNADTPKSEFTAGTAPTASELFDLFLFIHIWFWPLEWSVDIEVAGGAGQNDGNQRPHEDHFDVRVTSFSKWLSVAVICRCAVTCA